MDTVLPVIIVFAGLVSVAVIVIFELRRTPKQEAEMIEREDEAIFKVRDDPREIAQWVR